MQGKITEKKRISTLATLIIAGESVFFLPFVLARIFRPTLLSVFDITNTELGIYFSTYGIVAIISYVFGGVLADRFAARKLMAAALWLTSAGGIVMARLPSTGVMVVLYGFWGFTTIFLFWAAMIRATREWGGDGFQGRAFGWLEGGRGATAAILGTISFLLFSWFTGDVNEMGEAGSGFLPFQMVIMILSGITFLSGILVWYLVPDSKVIAESRSRTEVFRRVLRLIRLPAVWMLAVIIVCAYAGYKITDDFSLYAREVLGYSEISSAGIGTAALWIRAFAAIMAGYLADRLDKFKLIIFCFGLTMVGGLLMGMGLLEGVVGLVLFNLTLTAIGIYGVRALYFAVFQEANIPLGFTGTAVGIVSFVGYTPDIFMSPWMGHLLDKYPGNTGHQYLFLVLSMFAFIGLLTSLVFRYVENRGGIEIQQ
ncbi:MAG TPA: MFS transporter [Bacteroides sp.]|nr:MFS transporter [Bacteroides sp.]